MVKSKSKIALERTYNDGLNLRKASSEDTADILNLIRKNHVKITNNELLGFLCHKPSIKDLHHRLKFGSYNQIAIFNTEIAGFFTAFSNEEANEYLTNGFLEYEDEVLNAIPEEKYIWLDQLAIHPPALYRNRIGSRLMKNLVYECYNIGYTNFLGTVSIAPETNIASLNFLQSLGFRLYSTITMDKRKWVIVKLKL